MFVAGVLSFVSFKDKEVVNFNSTESSERVLVPSWLLVTDLSHVCLVRRRLNTISHSLEVVN